jgi:signal transduction histidine kinase
MEMHDGIIRSLYAIGIHLDLMRISSASPSGDLKTAIDDLNSVITDIRRYILNLRRRAATGKERSMKACTTSLPGCISLKRSG